MNWRGGIRRDKTDALFSELVRERADWVCEYCGRDYKHDRGRLTCSHVFGRRRAGTRIHPLNSTALCQDCHAALGENPVDHAEWVKRQIGEEKYDRLRIIANKPTKLTNGDKELIHKHFLSERKRMQKLRAEGVRGRIEFDLPGN